MSSGSGTRGTAAGAVAVVIPTYERAGLVERALASVAAQTRPPAEVIVVDDGSTDGTAERVARAFPEVTLLTQENLGVSAARNRGIRESKSEWLAFLDSDDEWAPPKLERQVADLAASRHRIGHCEEIWIRDGQRVNAGERHAKRGGWIYRHCLPLCAISPSAAVIHRSVLDRVGMFDESLPVCEDYDLWLRVTAEFPVRLLDEPLVTKYGGHADQLSRALWGMDRFRVRALEGAWRTLELTLADRIATLETLIAKIEILLSGARKRQRRDLVEDLERRLPHFSHLLDLERMFS